MACAGITTIPREVVFLMMECMDINKLLAFSATCKDYRALSRRVNVKGTVTANGGEMVKDISTILPRTQKLELVGLETPYANANFACFRCLHHIIVSGNSIGDIIFLCTLTSVQILELPYTQVSDVSPLSKLTSLQTLYLSDTQVSNMSPLSELTSLLNLDLSKTC